MSVDPRLLADLQRSEGCELKAYRDTNGFWTIGFGHLLEQGIDWTGHVITMDTAVSLLALDAEDRYNQATTLDEWPALDTSCRQNAIAECVYNLGLGHWQRDFPATRRSIQQRDWQSASANLLDSPLWIQQVGITRVQRLANYLQVGAYPTSS